MHKPCICGNTSLNTFYTSIFTNFMHGFCPNRGIEFVEGLKPGTGISEGEITLPAKHEFLKFGNAGLNRNSTL